MDTFLVNLRSTLYPVLKIKWGFRVGKGYVSGVEERGVRGGFFGGGGRGVKKQL